MSEATKRMGSVAKAEGVMGPMEEADGGVGIGMEAEEDGVDEAWTEEEIRVLKTKGTGNDLIC